MHLRFVPRLPGIIMLIVITFLVHAAAAYRKFALSSLGMFHSWCSGSWITVIPAVWHVRLVLKYAHLLFVRFGTLHGLTSTFQVRAVRMM